MSSGSYLTLYRKLGNEKAPQDVLEALKNEYYLSNKKDSFKDMDEAKMKEDIPVLMCSTFKAELDPSGKKSREHYSADGTKHIELMSFHFSSSFTVLREHFGLNPYYFSTHSTLISKQDAEKMLQAVDYILSGEYSKKFEETLSNEYVAALGDGLSSFDNRFAPKSTPLRISKHGDDYVVTQDDYMHDLDTTECDDSIKASLKRLKGCLVAYLESDECFWDNEELVLECSVY